MLVVLPFCHRDAALAKLLAAEIARLGNCAGHRALVAGSSLAVEHVDEIARALEAAGFDEVQREVLPRVIEKGWPTSPNYVFREVVEMLDFKKNVWPWLFMEPDCTPIGADWLQRIDADHSKAAKPFGGAVVPTRVIRNGVEGVDGEHLVGAGIYPRDTKARLTLLRWATDVPWDVYCQWEMMRHGWHNSPLFQHNWNTRSYRREGDQIICSPMNDLSLVQPVREGIALLHGCKDGSLIRLLSQTGEAVDPMAAGSTAPSFVAPMPNKRPKKTP